jgi:flagella basal body P-ring formation protein FlgA
MSRRSFGRTAILAITLTSAGLAPVFAQEKVLVTRRVVYPGETVDMDALREVTLKAGKVAPASAVHTAEQIEGKVARRTLLPGHYISTSSLREAYLVEPGAAVQVLYEAGALKITATAVTLEAGSAGDVVKLRNIDSGKVFSGVVMADGSVRVGAT